MSNLTVLWWSGYHGVMPRIVCPAICLREMPWSSTSQLVTLLTPEHGKVRGLAKGSRRTSPSSVMRFSGGFELAQQGQCVVNVRPSSSLAGITEWNLLADAGRLRRDLPALRFAMLALQLTDAMLADHDPHQRVYAQAVALLDLLRDDQRTTPTERRSAEHLRQLLVFQWVLLDETGYRPQLDRDVETGEPIEHQPAYRFDPPHGGLTCHNVAGQWQVRAGTVNVLRTLTQGLGDTSLVGALDTIDDTAISRANRLLTAYVRFLLDNHLPTMDVLLSP